jgi:hypothetical protein
MTAVSAALLVAVLLAVVAWIISSPFRGRGTAAAGAGAFDSDERRALESARESKYAEIRDNETDHQTGKLSDEDYRALDDGLRAEAVEILRRLDSLPAAAGGDER